MLLADSTVYRPDAGLRPMDHYKDHLPAWRYIPRQFLLSLIRKESSYLAALQKNVRRPFWDAYFAWTANLGTHTFFMFMLPLWFWLGGQHFGQGLVDVLGVGLFFTGVLKDLLCLPRPLSPPLHRISMSRNVCLEYGFPSTHSANAVAVALYSIAFLHASELQMLSKSILGVLALIYLTNLHFEDIAKPLDIFAGSAIGALVCYLRWTFKSDIESVVISQSIMVPLVLVPTTLLLIRLHPEPVDPCPCFDDGVAFASVIMGTHLGHWRFAMSYVGYPIGSITYNFGKTGIFISIARIALGITTIISWRVLMKPLLFTLLPPVFRFFELLGLSIPRKHYIKASTYIRVPDKLPDESLLNLEEIPGLINRINRSHSESTGPQSRADVYEAIEYHEQQKILGNKNRFISDAKYQAIEEPRVRYDVEVITKIIVYSGIGWLVNDQIPILFKVLGLCV
ncbi:Dihydrosphingosine 1-phosphate phosphatase [Neolecta irregularis DAH-3]|uniref:Dihydrosphingosine 1-phosphate phosphatase n=1 Tax=Neolecta irregularis (strain DAH-3) TaxID=1198029 RepID=A0A1U7LX31_NEOID|nr:Dihydrosphingosine 1-phosphate phosphatase [Neolecta irregularis DAH-3]|eukprot:OLL27081.1 Dihydrosphingosine 1-phosphate phosphatase [Neolecta irregularis DAH-3]